MMMIFGYSRISKGDDQNARLQLQAFKNAGVEKTYNIQGTADHNHTVTLTASDFTKLKANTGISETSSSASAHTHLIEVGCA
jgi:hypothetical protein